MEKNLNNIKLNITIGVFQSEALPTVFKQSADGLFYPILKSFRRLLELITVHGNFNGIIVVAEEGQFGQLKENGYEGGILGLLQTGEAELSMTPIYLTTARAPGFFTSVVGDDQYYLASFPRSSSSSLVNQNVVASFALFSPSIWIVTLLTVYFFELFLTYQYSMTYMSWLHLAIDAAKRLPCILFSQYIPNRSTLRSTQMLLLTAVMAIFMASFNTNTIGEDRVPRVNTLRDIVDLDMTPTFWNGFSLFEMFEAGVTKDYADVYDLAVRKGTAKATNLNIENEYFSFSPEIVTILSGKVGKLGNPIDETDLPEAKYSYWSEKPFHQSLLALLANPRQNVDQKTKRLNLLTSKLMQTGIADRLTNAVIIEVILKADLFALDPFVFVKRTLKSPKETKFVPLKADGLKLCYIALFLGVFSALIICLVEIILSKIIH